MIRKVGTVEHAVMLQEGDGIAVRRAVPHANLRETNPFVLIEEMGPVNLAAADVRTVPPHPTRGFEQVTWVLQGNVVHTRPDRAGTTIANNIAADNVEWVTTGAGHLQREALPAGVDVRTVRVWISLPREERNAPVRVVTKPPTTDQLQMWTPAQVYSGELRIELIAGRLLGARASVQSRTRATVARVQLPADVTFVHAVDSIEPGRVPPTVVLYGLNGLAVVGPGPVSSRDERLVSAGDVAVLTPPSMPSARPNDDEVRIRTRAGETFDCLWLCGDPVGTRGAEPLVHRGTFVMRTEEEVLQAIEDYYTGRFGTLTP
jgi:quercetin 2,3-dioxygenase